MQQLAQQQFKNGNYQKAIQLYNQFINSVSNQGIQINKINEGTQAQQIIKALLNLSSAYFSFGQYQSSMSTCLKYSLRCKQMKSQPKVQCYILYCRSLIKLKKLLTHQQHQIVEQASKLFPYHKVLNQCIKTVKQLQISQNQNQYMDKIFEKLLSHPKIRTYLIQESFLTKVQKIIRNPSLSSALCKLDKRLEQVTEMILMAEEDQDEMAQQQKNKK